MKIGLVGLGAMGLPIATRLAAAGHQLLVNDLFLADRPLPAELATQGAKACFSLGRLAQDSELTITVLRETADVERVLFGADGLATGLGPGKIFLDLSSIDPVRTRAFAARLQAEGTNYMDAPVSGGLQAAREGRLKMLCGGSAQTFVALQSIFSVLAVTVRHLGDVGAGQAAKVAHQIIVALTMQAVAEGFLFAARAGLDLERLRETLMQGYANSRILDVQGQRLIRRAFEEPGFPLALEHKDLSTALAAAEELGLELPATQSVHDLLEEALRLGDGDRDHAVIMTLLERLSQRS